MGIFSRFAKKYQDRLRITLLTAVITCLNSLGTATRRGARVGHQDRHGRCVPDFCEYSVEIGRTCPQSAVGEENCAATNTSYLRICYNDENEWNFGGDSRFDVGERQNTNRSISIQTHEASGCVV